MKQPSVGLHEAESAVRDECAGAVMMMAASIFIVSVFYKIDSLFFSTYSLWRVVSLAVNVMSVGDGVGF